ncbi:ShlB/FhaC/HecB family hemolysin secretion/activation protein [Arsenophonus apicola]|uniref:ShlB/FhaC/HecB family hemolysin secretion/activation protein n=1 Tax=Arsenophonus apicola TaxID=2879119 RepID=A0ABY8P1V0_9GAMM|nr:ShlB/FhaC/HecB family hemolysin secretion/activation protein [Arsenophonus apicola]WGO83475.1 ShlB/FhaC/HecB family hemolysin secretion/activation protein [Arsenophonus apicola]
MKKYLFFLLVAIYGHGYAQVDAGKSSLQQAKQEITHQQPVAIPINLQQINKNQIYPVEFPCLNINFVFFNSQELFATSLQKKLSSLADNIIGQCLGDEGIKIFLTKVNQMFIDSGYVTTKISLPEQSFIYGILRIELIPGLISDIRYADTGKSHYSLCTAFPQATILNLRDIEQGLENLQNSPSTQPKITVDDDPNTANSSILTINRQKKRAIRGRLSVDNNGLKDHANLMIDNVLMFDNPTLLNDFFYFYISRDLDTDHSRGVKIGTFFYSLPFRNWQFNLSGNYQDQYSADGIKTSVGNLYKSSRSKSLTAQVQYLIKRRYDSKTYLNFGTSIATNNGYVGSIEIISHKRRATYWNIGLKHQRYLPRGELNLAMEYKQGANWFGAMPSPATDLKRPQIFNFSVAINQPWQISKQIFLYKATAAMQLSRSRLDSLLEAKSIGDSSRVRGAMLTNTLSGSHSLLIKNELSWYTPLPSHVLYATLDYGSVSEDRARFWRDEYLVGTSLGLKGSYKQLGYTIFVGFPLLNSSDSKQDHMVSGFRLTFSY